MINVLLKRFLQKYTTAFFFVTFQDICCDVDSKRDDMKWMVQVLDSLLPYVSEEQRHAEQRNLEGLVGRYKHLIPTIDMTITKTEMYTKCFVYKKEVSEVSTWPLVRLCTRLRVVKLYSKITYVF